MLFSLLCAWVKSIANWTSVGVGYSVSCPKNSKAELNGVEITQIIHLVFTLQLVRSDTLHVLHTLTLHQSSFSSAHIS